MSSTCELPPCTNPAPTNLGYVEILKPKPTTYAQFNIAGCIIPIRNTVLPTLNHKVTDIVAGTNNYSYPELKINVLTYYYGTNQCHSSVSYVAKDSRSALDLLLNRIKINYPNFPYALAITLETGCGQCAVGSGKSLQWQIIIENMNGNPYNSQLYITECIKASAEINSNFLPTDNNDSPKPCN